jgi:hypothetical protein
VGAVGQFDICATASGNSGGALHLRGQTWSGTAHTYIDLTIVVVVVLSITPVYTPI